MPPQVLDTDPCGVEVDPDVEYPIMPSAGYCLVEQNLGTESGFASELTVDRLLGAVVLIEEWRKTRSTVGIEICIECFMRNRNS